MITKLLNKPSVLFTILAVIALGVFFIALPTSSSAQTGRAITIIPPNFELFANPGDSITEVMRVRNDSEFPETFSVVLEDFAAAGEEGEVVLEEPEDTFSLARWIEPEARDIILQPREERPFRFTINVPRDAEPGGHYASLLLASAGEDIEGGAAVTQRIGSLILLRVSGNVVEEALIESFHVPSHSQAGPIEFALRVKNEGNVHVRPRGTIIITNILGQKVDEIPLAGANVIPGAVRRMVTTWDNPGTIGHYTATLVATYGQQNMPLTAAARFTVASTTSLILLGVGLIAAVLFISSLLSGRSRVIKALKVMFSGD